MNTPTNALAKLGLNTKQITVETVREMGCEAVSFLPRLELMTLSKELVKQGKYLGKPNTWALVETGGATIPIDATVEAILVDWRPLAVDFKAKTRFFDEASDEFKNIIQRADASNEANCGYGPQFLLYIPALQRCVNWWASNRSSKFAWMQATSAFVPEDGSYNGKVLEFASRFQTFKKGGQQVVSLAFKQDREVEIDDATLAIIKDGIDKFNADMKAAEENENATDTAARSR